jgi:hypothetical protein
MNKKENTFKRCQFRTGLAGKHFTKIKTCTKPATWDVIDKDGKKVGHVCNEHALSATRGGFKLG